MKRVLLIGIILAILILAMPQGVSAASTAVVTAQVKDYISFTAVGPVSNWPLYFAVVPGVAESASAPDNYQIGALALSVTSNTPWKIQVSGESGGYLRPYAGSAYTGTPLVNPLGIGKTAYQAVTGSLTTLQDETGTATTTYTDTYNYKQTLAVTDITGPTYRTVLTFDCSFNG
jgi:hypothetical protein